MRKAYLPLVLAAAALTCVAAAAHGAAVAAGAFTYRGTVTHIVDGDTLDVRLTSGKTERIRLIGIDTPERGVCYSAKATARARQLAMSKRVVLRGTRPRTRATATDASSPTSGSRRQGPRLSADRRRLREGLRVPGCVPAAARLPERGSGGEGRDRRAVEGLRASTPHRLRRAPPAASTAVRLDCHPSYSPCLPIVGDLDCADIRAHGRRAGSRSRLGSVPAGRRQRRLGLRVAGG